mmetsp:Transcript_12174/g.24284  ORF Transcript_12174/g.24284 Transcript_12174/m.24284 type:complete len:82 (+) Transcript_12174:1317-1562(+)
MGYRGGVGGWFLVGEAALIKNDVLRDKHGEAGSASYGCPVLLFWASLRSETQRGRSSGEGRRRLARVVAVDGENGCSNETT